MVNALRLGCKHKDCWLDRRRPEIAIVVSSDLRGYGWSRTSCPLQLEVSNYCLDRAIAVPDCYDVSTQTVEYFEEPDNVNRTLQPANARTSQY